MVQRRFVFIRDLDMFDPTRSKTYCYFANTLGSALLQFENELMLSYKEKVSIFTHFCSDYTFKYVIMFEDNKKLLAPVLVEVYEE